MGSQGVDLQLLQALLQQLEAAQGGGTDVEARAAVARLQGQLDTLAQLQQQDPTQHPAAQPVTSSSGTAPPLEPEPAVLEAELNSLDTRLQSLESRLEQLDPAVHELVLTSAGDWMAALQQQQQGGAGGPSHLQGEEQQQNGG